MSKSFKSLSNYLSNIEEQQNNKPLTHDSLITAAITTSERLIIEIKEIEENILTPKKRYNDYSLLILGAYLKGIIEDLINIKQNNLKI